MLGQAVVTALAQRSPAIEVLAFKRQDFDITNPEHHAEWILNRSGQIDVVINCSAYTAVDRAESERQMAFEVNGLGVGYLAATIQSIGAQLIHVSTDFVFDGRSVHPYQEDDAVSPIGAYGASKLHGEEALAGIGLATVVRTSWLFGPDGACFPRSIINAYRARKSLKVVADQIGTPTYAPFLAEMLVRIAESNLPGGTYHAAGPEICSWHSFATKAVSAAGGLISDVRACRTEDYPTPTARPAYSALDCSKLVRAGCYFHPTLNESLPAFVETLG
jgi:dTDP-4-dehydrorhamnose reductase